MRIFVTGCFLLISLTPVLSDASPKSPLPVLKPEFGARIRHPEVIMTLSSNTFGTKSSKNSQSSSLSSSSSPSTEVPETVTRLENNSGNDEDFNENISREEDESFNENSLGEFSVQSSRHDAQRSMNEIAERMKMKSLRKAMQSIQNDRDDSENPSEQQQENDDDDGENEQQFVEQESFDDNRPFRSGKKSHINGHGDIQIAVKSRRKYEMSPVHFDRQTEKTPRMIEIVSDTMPLRLHFRSKSSAIVVSQSHDPSK